jgi:D-galactarolactone cycloisomerase
MKISSITTTLIHIPYEAGAPTKLAGQSWSRMAILLVRVDTDEGVTGWGEAFGHAIAPATKATLDTIVAAHFIGRDRTDAEALMGEMFQRLHIFGRNGSVIYALSGIDIALWDIAGKRAGQPIHKLLGANAPRELTAYASLLRYGEADTVARMAARAAGEGYRFIKLHEIAVPEVKTARAAVGADVALMCDTNCPWSVAQAIEMATAFRPFDLYWLEEPVWPPEDYQGLAQVRQAGVPIAAGENAAGAHAFRHMFAVGAIDIAQPSMTKIGGIGECAKSPRSPRWRACGWCRTAPISDPDFSLRCTRRRCWRRRRRSSGSTSPWRPALSAPGPTRSAARSRCRTAPGSAAIPRWRWSSATAARLTT